MPVRGKLPILIAGAAIAGLLVFERARPLRRRTRPALPRNLRNAALGALSVAVMEAGEVPLARHVAAGNANKPRGLAALVPSALRGAVAFAAMDYGMYLWHIATHRSRLLWRFHRLHHRDPDLDASTALRFHATEVLLSLPFRLLQVRASGITPAELRVWRRFFNASILFHHANLALPAGWDRKIGWIFPTPRMHGIHHSAAKAERDSNWSSGLSIWDRLHGTLRQDVPQSRLTIGLAEEEGADGSQR